MGWHLKVIFARLRGMRRREHAWSSCSLSLDLSSPSLLSQRFPIVALINFDSIHRDAHFHRSKNRVQPRARPDAKLQRDF